MYEISAGVLSQHHPFFSMRIFATDRVNEDDIETFNLELDPMGSLVFTL